MSLEEKSTLDFFCVLALCRGWKLDTAYVLSSLDNEEKPMPAANAAINSIKFKVLDDPAYPGTYYGYLLSNKRDDCRLYKLRLKIENTKVGGFTASLTVESKVILKDGVQTL